MEVRRLIIFLVFIFSLTLLWENWQRDMKSLPASVADGRSALPASGSLPGRSAGHSVTGERGAPGAELKRVPETAPVPQLSSPPLIIENDLVRVTISPVGGEIRRIELLQHRDPVDRDKNLVLLSTSAEHTYVAQSGLLGRDANGHELPNHKTVFRILPGSTQFTPGQDQVHVRLQADAGPSLLVTKHIALTRGSYLLDVGYELTNTGGVAVKPEAYFQLVRDGNAPAGEQRFVSTFTGGAVYTDKYKFQKVNFAEIDKAEQKHALQSTDGWIALVQHYFVSAWLPESGKAREFYSRALGGGLYAFGTILPFGEIAPGKSSSIKVALYSGPQEQDKLKQLAPGLELVVDYGWLTVIASTLFAFLGILHGWAHNWGVAIIILTVIIKLVFFPLSAASYRSMAKMRVVTPRMVKIRETYANDKVKMNQAMMELYKTEKINPLGGCLPIVVQIPVFIALYWVLLGSVEMRNAPFALWIKDLSSPDPFYVLPIIMGATMLIQTKLNPTPPDPVQAKVMMIMPVAFSIFFFFFPAGLVLYWVVNNVLSIAQQWQITRMFERGKSVARR